MNRLPVLPGRESATDSAAVWRYMDLPKYLDLLRTSQLHLAPLIEMEDRWEGAVGPMELDSAVENLMSDQNVNRDFAERAIANSERQSEDDRGRAYVNCWHLSNAESAAMWSLYAQTGRGIAVKTTWERLVTCVIEPERLVIAPVEYTEYDAPVTDFRPQNLFSLKRKSFEHEKEIRVMRFDGSDPSRRKTAEELARTSQKEIESSWINHEEIIDRSLRRPFYRYQVDLSWLVREVVMAPNCPEWQREAIADVSRLYGLKAQVNRSAIERPASYNRYENVVMSDELRSGT